MPYDVCDSDASLTCCRRNRSMQNFFGGLLCKRGVASKPGGHLFFVYLPAISRYGYWSGLAGNNERIRQVIVSVVRDVGLTVIDMREITAATVAPTDFFNMHLSVAGHRLVAEAIAREPALTHK